MKKYFFLAMVSAFIFGTIACHDTQDLNPSDSDTTSETNLGTDVDSETETDSNGNEDSESHNDSETETDTGPSSCIDLSNVDFGDCEMIIGFAHNGTTCQAFSGCDCEPYCNSLSDDLATCAKKCSDEGVCNTTLSGMDFLELDDTEPYCEYVQICVEDMYQDYYNENFDNVDCQNPQTSCEAGVSCSTSIQSHGGEPLTQAAIADICALSLISNTTSLQCGILLK